MPVKPRLKRGGEKKNKKGGGPGDTVSRETVRRREWDSGACVPLKHGNFVRAALQLSIACDSKMQKADHHPPREIGK